MSDSHHDHEPGGHEIDKMPNARLFNLLFGLSILTFVACLGVIQLFNRQVEDIENQRAAKGSYKLADYNAKMAAVAEGYGKTTIPEEGAEEPVTRYFIPEAQARKQLLDNPELLSGAKAYPGWENTGTFGTIKEWGGMPRADSNQPKEAPEGEAADGEPTPEQLDAGAEPAADAQGAAEGEQDQDANPAVEEPGAEKGEPEPGTPGKQRGDAGAEEDAQDDVQPGAGAQDDAKKPEQGEPANEPE